MNRDELPHDSPPYLETANAAMERAIATARRVANSDVPVLLSGESGTGKHVLAEAIHHWGNCPAAPFVALPRVTVTHPRQERERASCTRTSATAGDEDFETIHGGTLFCEEVGDLDFDQQAKLIRLLDEHRFAEEGHVIWEGLRVIVASRRDLDAEVCAGRFRGELFVRLSDVMITLPPLRDRPEDLPRLTEYLLDNLARHHHRRNVRLAPEAREVFERYHWPGNVRELVSILERAVVLLRDDVIRTRDLPDRLVAAPSRAHVSEPSEVYPHEIQRA